MYIVRYRKKRKSLVDVYIVRYQKKRKSLVDVYIVRYKKKERNKVTYRLKDGEPSEGDVYIGEVSKEEEKKLGMR